MADRQVETWQNPGQSRVVVRRLNHRDELVNDEMVGPGRTFTITSTERELNQQLANSPEQDVFRNGRLVPVQLLEGSDIAREVATNPNLLTDGDMRVLATAGTQSKSLEAAAAFQHRLSQITNPTTLERLYQLAIDEDAPYSRVTAIMRRLGEVGGPTYQPATTTPDPALGPSAAGTPGGPAAQTAAAPPGMRAVTPR